MTPDPRDHSASTAPASIPNGYPTKTDSASAPPRSLYDVCLEISKKVDSLLAESPSTALLRDTQARVREAMGVVDEAFDRFGYVSNAGGAHPSSFVGFYSSLMPYRTGSGKYLYRIMAGKTVCEHVGPLYIVTRDVGADFST